MPGFLRTSYPTAGGHHFTHEERHDEAISRDAHTTARASLKLRSVKTVTVVRKIEGVIATRDPTPDPGETRFSLYYLRRDTVTGTSFPPDAP